MLTGLPQQPLYPGRKPYALTDKLLDEPGHLYALLIALERALLDPGPARGKAAKTLRDKDRMR